MVVFCHHLISKEYHDLTAAVLITNFYRFILMMEITKIKYHSANHEFWFIK